MTTQRKWTVTVKSLGTEKVYEFDTQAEAQRFADGVYDRALDRPGDRRADRR